MNNIKDFALNIIGNNPSIASNPNAQQMIDVIRRGDAAQGEQIANNLCETYGISRDQAIQQARSLFHI